MSQLVDTPEGIANLVAELADAPDIALDTEGNSFHAYRDRVCLIQLAIAPKSIGTPLPDPHVPAEGQSSTAGPPQAGEGKEVVLAEPVAPAEGNEALEEPRIFLVDPIAADPRALGPIFADPRHRLVVHGGDFDVRSLRRDFGFTFGRMFDTMLAAQTLKLSELGLVALLKRELDVTIGKGEQRSDWGKRPLRPEQLTYGAKDVRYLLPLAAKLQAQLVAADKVVLAGIQFEKLRHLVAREKTFDGEGYRGIKGARGLAHGQLGVLRVLWLGRERLASELNRAPFKIIGEQAMFDVARRLPPDLETLRKVPGVGDLIVRRLGAEVVAEVASAAQDGSQLSLKI